MSFKDKILNYFQLKPTDYDEIIKPKSIENFLDLSLFPNIPSIVNAIQHGIANHETFLVYGDYDADGMLATAIMVRTLKRLGANVSSYLPSRYMDGYGIQADKIDRMAQKKFQWLITVDNGINANAAIDKAIAYGMKVVITDHHQLVDPLPKTPFILHPHHVSTNTLPMCGSLMALYLSAGLLGTIDPFLSALAGIATLADYMPLIGINRLMVKHALQIINSQSLPIITRLIGNDPVDEVTLNMKWIPMLNSIGRLVENQNINRVTVFLTTDDEEERFLLSDWIKVIYQQRKDLSKKAIEQLQYDQEQPAIVIKVSEKEGMIGLLATRLGQQTQKPVFIVSDSNPLTEGFVGSSRAQESQSVLLALQTAESFLIRFGGHHGAAGFEVKKNQFEEFKEHIYNYYRTKLANHTFAKHTIIPLSEHEFTLENYRFLVALKPFGRSFPSPLFRLEKLETAALRFIKEGSILSHPWKGFKLFSFQLKRTDIEALTHIDVIGEFRINYYLGQQEIQFLVLEYLPTPSHQSS
jgi:single-stranded-DNA-specific exonuclease